MSKVLKKKAKIEIKYDDEKELKNDIKTNKNTDKIISHKIDKKIVKKKDTKTVKKQDKNISNYKPEINSIDIMLVFFAKNVLLYWKKKKCITKNLWELFMKEYDHLCRINFKEMSNQKIKKQVHSSLVAISMKRSMIKNGYKLNQIRKHIFGMFELMCKPLFKGIGNKIKKLYKQRNINNDQSLNWRGVKHRRASAESKQ